MQLLPYLLTTGLIGQAMAVNMSSRFTVSSTCSTSKVNDMLTETIDMVNNAIQGIDTLLNAGVKFNPNVASNAIKSLTKAATTAWGVSEPKWWSSSLSAADTTQLKAAQSNYQRLYAALNSGKGMTASENTLFCDDSTLKWTTKAIDIFPDGGTMTTVEYWLWKDPDNKRGKNYNFMIDEYNGGQMCGPKSAEAITYWQTQNMFMCPEAFNTAHYKTSLKSMRSSTDEVEVEWDNVRSLSGIFLHEMMYFLDLSPHVVDQKVFGDKGTQMAAYGMIAVWMLGGKAGEETVDRSKALTNADSYNVFATMAYLQSAEYEMENARLSERGEEIEEERQELEEQIQELEDQRLENIEESEEQKQELEERIEYIEEIEEQKGELESRVEHLQEVVWEHGLEGDCAYRWSDTLKEQLATAFRDRRSNCYAKVRALIVRWASDDLDLFQEVDDLASVFEHSYHFKVAKFIIPDLHPANALLSRVLKFIGDNSPDTLLIFSYNGHRGFHDTRNDHIWHATREHGGPCMPSSGIQTLLEESRSDAILFYDACYFADTAMTLSPSAGSVTELIASCGFQTTAPAGDNSFTCALIRELSLAATQEAISVSELYNRILARLRNSRNRQNNTTPVHCTLISDGDRTSIMLEDLPLPLAAASYQSSADENDRTVVYHIGLVGERQAKNSSSIILKWLLRAPSYITDIKLNRINVQRQVPSDDGYESQSRPSTPKLEIKEEAIKMEWPVDNEPKHNSIKIEAQF
ncbi:hypothetical protein SBOR_9850 [Sclerotinia borealis F-4128]|uniref:Uncharacterized protein n=1 Tax=Sclerotinia borealis (strain F-4128) TaxID=1432307 RepID=W9BYT9_SCLBF|nr:hypothetical protein SBOR_9850 [Sclerotinia borealis F-4128]